METSTEDWASNVDIQGTKRGKCNKCNECKSFMVSAKGQIRCEYCDHTPADHVRIIKLGACTSCNDCKEYMPETPTEYSNCMYCDCLSSCHTGADELRKPKRPPSAMPSDTTTASFSALSNSMSSGYSAKPPHLCIVPDCPYPKRVEGNKTHEFCSRTCAQKYQVFQSLVGANPMMTTGGGGAPAPPPGASFPGGPYPAPPPGASFPGGPYPALPPGASFSGGPYLAPPPAAKPGNICIVPGCTKPKYNDGTTVHDFCGRNCAKKGAGLQVAQTAPPAGQPAYATAQPSTGTGFAANRGPLPTGPSPAGPLLTGPLPAGPPSTGPPPAGPVTQAGSVKPPGT